jgi:hypothetical protein
MEKEVYAKMEQIPITSNNNKKGCHLNGSL